MPGLEESGFLRRRQAVRQGAGAGLRHLSRMPALRQPVPELSRPCSTWSTSPTPWRSTGSPRGLLEGRRPVLPLRPVLHDQMPLRAAARVERRLPAPDASGQGVSTSGRKAHRCVTACLTSTDRTFSVATIPLVDVTVNAVNRSAGLRKLIDKVRRHTPRGTGAELQQPDPAQTGTAPDPGDGAPAGWQHHGQGSAVRHLLRQLQQS
jgi:hypothetical protein